MKVNRVVPKTKSSRRKPKRKTHAKSKPAIHSKVLKPRIRPETKRAETSVPILTPVLMEPLARESYRITVENIRGETAIGDLLVAFPRTREVLVRNGMKLEAEDAGDIYITLDAFSALNGLKTEILIQDLVGIAKESPLQQASQQPVHQIPTTPAI
jgi:hypothetical protein